MTIHSDNITPLPPMTEAVARLPHHMAVILCQLALLGELSKTALLDNLHILDISPVSHRRMNSAEITWALDLLLEQGWLQKAETRWKLAPGHENAVFLWLRMQPDAHRVLQENASPLYLRGALRPGRSRLWLSVLAGDTATLPLRLAEWMNAYDYDCATHPAISLFGDDAGRRLFSLLDSDVQTILLATALSDAGYQLSDCTNIWLFARDHANTHAMIPDMLRGPLALQALWRDERDLLNKLESGNLPLPVAGWIALCRGDREAAMEVYRQLVSQYRKATRKRRLHLPPLTSIMAALTLLTSDESPHTATLHELTLHAVEESFGFGWLLLMELLKERSGTPSLAPPPAPNRPLTGMAGVLHALVLFWRGEVSDPKSLHKRLEAFARQMEQYGYRLPAYEIRTLLHQQFSEPAPASLADRFPLNALWQRKAAWEYALDALSQLTPTKNNESTSRLAWLLRAERYGTELVPLEQKRNKQGWSKGRPVALKRLHGCAETLPWLLAQDRQAARHIHYTAGYFYDNGRYELDVGAALPLLAGHPAVFWYDAPDIRVDIEYGQVTLVLTEEGNQLSLALSPAISAPQHLVTEKETPTRLVVYPISDEHRRIAAIIGQGLRIPLTAREKVLQSVSAIAPLLPVRADLPELMAHIPHVPADDRIYAHLLPLGEGVRLQLLVRPLPEGPWFPPGRGGEIISGEQDGQAVQTQRDLQHERKKQQLVLRSCPLLADTEQDGAEWQFTEPQDALDALTQLRSTDNQLLECVWPEGERLRLSGRRDMQSLTLNVRRHGEWFALSGGLTLDDGRVVELRQLLKLLQESKGRFIRLGEEDWLALDNQLRQRLQQIALLAGDNEHLTLNALTLPFLKSLAGESGEFDGDADWHRQLRGLDAREKHRPAVPSTLKAELRDYQEDGFCWLSRLAQWGVGACLADDMGLGKTLQALAILLERAPGGPQLVVTPTSVTHNWLSESDRFAPTLKVRDYRRHRDLSQMGAFDVVVVSYGLLLQDAKAFATQTWHSIVLDEAQSIKNAQTQRARAVVALKADFRLALSGTPVENHLGELWSLFRFLNPGLLGSLKSFNQRFVSPAEQGDRLAAGMLKQLIKPFVLRRTKAQVLDELPPRTDVLYQIPMSEEELHWYEALRQQAVERLEVGDDVSPLQVASRSPFSIPRCSPFSIPRRSPISMPCSMPCLIPFSMPFCSSCCAIVISSSPCCGTRCASSRTKTSGSTASPACTR